MRKYVPAFMIVLAVTHLPGWGEQQGQKPVLAVLEFSASDISSSEARLISDYVTNHIVETGTHRVVDRAQRQAILEEIEFSYSECVDEACQLEIGRLLSVSTIVVGSVGKVGNRIILNMKLIDVQTGETIRTASLKNANLDELVDNCQSAVSRLLGIESKVSQGQIIETPTSGANQAVTERESTKGSERDAVIVAEKKPVVNRKGASIEVSAGYLRLVGDLMTASGAALELGFSYQFNNLFSIRIAPHLALGPGGTAQLILGNKVDGLAFSILAGGTMVINGLCAGGGLFYRGLTLEFIYLGIPTSPQHDPSWSGFAVLGGYSWHFNYLKARRSKGAP